MKPTIFKVLLFSGLTVIAALARQNPNYPDGGMIATANPIASEAGREILRAGGSAVDAAIASQLVLTLVEPQSSGIGGGAFLMHFQRKTKKIEAYDGRETAPLAISADVFQDPDGKRRAFSDISAGGAAVGVPGVVRMLALAHKDHGKLSWNRLFEPAIRLAEEGFAVSPRLNAMIKNAQDLKSFHAARNYFYTPSGEPLPVGHRLRNPALADTLRRIAAGGPDAFYVGVIARDIAAVKNANRNPATMTIADIAQYTAKKRRLFVGSIENTAFAACRRQNIRWTNGAADPWPSGTFRHAKIPTGLCQGYTFDFRGQPSGICRSRTVHRRSRFCRGASTRVVERLLPEG